MTKASIKVKDYTPQILSSHQKNKQLALRAVGIYVVGEAILRTPRKTGYLISRNNFEIPTLDAVEIFNDAQYAAFVEQGTSKQEAQPYIRPAVEENSSNIRNIFNRYIGVSRR